METPHPSRISRREALRWIITASASVAALKYGALAENLPAPVKGQPSVPTFREPITPPQVSTATGYGTDPNLMKDYKPGDVWPLTMNEHERRTAAALCDVIIPADEESPSASQLHVEDFIDEWISAPYENHAKDRAIITAGLAWMDAESQRRFSKNFVELSERQKTKICDDIAWTGNVKPEFMEPAKFFNQFRNLASGGFYTTPEGMKDLKYVGNVPLASFEGPPPEALRKAGLI
jgi:hypothetical protein